MTSQQTAPLNEPIDVDIAIIGGGIAGCWLLRLLTEKGYRAVLFEADKLGCDQTLASQGMIHGGLKYALSGRLTGASEAIAGMPDRWRQCLAGEDAVDLSGVPLLADTYHMFAQRTTLGRLTSFFASKALRGRVNRLAPQAWPESFSGFNGIVYDLNDFVLDVPALLQRLVSGLEHLTFNHRVDGRDISATGNRYQISLADNTFHADTLISCAGNGSNELTSALDLDSLKGQHRPLKQVIVKPKHGVRLNAHCVTGIASNEPRLTITSHGEGADLVWYVGGLLATTGVSRTDDQQIDFARSELEYCVPWLDWQGAEFATLDVDRAEPYQTSGLKPDEAYVGRVGNFLQCYPTKLTLTPDLGDRVLRELSPATSSSTPGPDSQEPVKVGQQRW